MPSSRVFHSEAYDLYLYHNDHRYLVTGTVKEKLQYYENITHDFRYDSLTLTPCIC